MKKKTSKIRLSQLKYLLFLPIFLLSFCNSNFDEFTSSAENKLTKDAKVLTLMKAAIKSDLDNNSSKSLGKDSANKGINDEDDQCTHFLYPMSFEVYSRDDPDPVIWEINSDEELISFIDTLVASTTSYEFYIYFPITLLDTDGVATVLNGLTELEGTQQKAVEACAGINDDGSGGGSDGGSDDGSDDGSNDGSDDGSSGGSDDGGDTPPTTATLNITADDPTQ